MKLTVQEWAEIDRIKKSFDASGNMLVVNTDFLFACLNKTRTDGVDWDGAPDWAKFKVSDKFGKRYWCETMPIKDKKNHTWYVNSGRMIEASRQPNPLWERSLEVRPLEKKQTRNR